MTLKFPTLKKLMDYLRASRIANCEFSTGRFTLTSDFQAADITLATTYGATIIDNNAVQQPHEANRSLNHTLTHKQ